MCDNYQILLLHSTVYYSDCYHVMLEPSVNKSRSQLRPIWCKNRPMAEDYFCVLCSTVVCTRNQCAIGSLLTGGAYRTTPCPRDAIISPARTGGVAARLRSVTAVNVENTAILPKGRTSYITSKYFPSLVAVGPEQNA